MKARVFIKEVSQETKKVKWPRLKEVVYVALLVIVFASLAGLLCLLVDSVVYKFIKILLGI